jgi:transposase
MGADSSEIHVQNLDHLGIVAGIIDEMELVEQVDEMLGVHCQSVLTTGQVLKAMILNGLGFLSAPLYLFSQFFEGKAVAHLLGDGVEASQLNDDRLGRALDDCYEYGVTQLFTTLALRAARRFGVNTKRVHLDSSSMCVEGQYVDHEVAASVEPTEAELPCPVEITYGYSRDHRPDLKQFVMDTICSGDGDVPLYLRVANGNEVDSVGFRQVVSEYRHQWHFDGVLIADAALYTAENLKQMQGLKWISRVPLTLSDAQAVIRQVVPFAEWQGLSAGYRLIEMCTRYADVPQRWVIVESENRRDADLKALENRVQQAEQRQQQQLNQLMQQEFACQADAFSAAEKFQKSLRYHRLGQLNVEQKAHHGKRGRPKQGSSPQSYSYHIDATLIPDCEVIEEHQRIAGRFILATTVLKCEQLDALNGESLPALEGEPLTALEVLSEYKQQQSSERGFRFLKDPLFFTSAHYGVGDGDGVVSVSLYLGSTPTPASLERCQNHHPQSTGKAYR